jgi:hypothetical protein
MKKALLNHFRSNTLDFSARQVHGLERLKLTEGESAWGLYILN